MEPKKSKSIYNGVPLDWINGDEDGASLDSAEKSGPEAQADVQQEEVKPDSALPDKEELKKEDPEQSNTKEKKTSDADEKKKNTGETKKRNVPIKSNKSEKGKTDSDIKKNKGKKKQDPKKKTVEKERLKKLDADYRNKDRSHTESVKKIHEEIYSDEAEGNKKDLIIVGAAGAAVIIAFVFIIVNFSDVAYRKTSALINEGNYATAYRNIEDFYSRGKNVDKLVYQFSESCMRDRKYANAVEPIQYLSEDAVKNPEFFEQLVTDLIQHGRAELADKVITFMQNRGGTLQQLALKLERQYADLA